MVFNQLTTFPRETYENILEEMLHSSGSFNIYGSRTVSPSIQNFHHTIYSVYIFTDPIVCDDCHLRWLINEKRYLLTRVTDGMCANGTTFDQLDSQVYETRCLKNNATPNKAPPLTVIFVLFFIAFLLVWNVFWGNFKNSNKEIFSSMTTTNSNKVPYSV